MPRRTAMLKVFNVAGWMITTVLVLLSCQAALACSWVTVYNYEKVPPNFSVAFYLSDVPVRNAKATLYSVAGEQQSAQRSYVTDAKGQVALTDIKPGRYVLSVGEGHSQQSVAVEVVPDGKNLQTALVNRFTPPPPPKLREPILVRRLQGTVLDPSGAVIVGAKVIVEGAGSTRFEKLTLIADEVGHFDASVPDGQYLLTFQVRGFSEAKLPVEVAHEGKHAWAGAVVTLQIRTCDLDPDPNRFQVSELTESPHN